MKSNEKLYRWMTNALQLINIGSKSDTCRCIFTFRNNSCPSLMLKIIFPVS